jgi:hypothetical protein
MSDEGFINQLLDNTNSFYKLALSQWKIAKKLLGTKVTISRVKDSSKYQDVFGSIYTSTLLNDDDVTKFSYIILINMNDMKLIYSKNIDSFELFDNEDVLQVGDVISYSRKGQQYKFKVTKPESFSEAEGVLNKYTLLGIVETNSLK